jgi:hypothetical protein
VGETVLANQRDNQQMVRALGLTKVFDLDYSNHQMDQIKARVPRPDAQGGRVAEK